MMDIILATFKDLFATFGITVGGRIVLRNLEIASARSNQGLAMTVGVWAVCK